MKSLRIGKVRLDVYKRQKEGYEKSAEAAAMILRGDVEAAMNEYNRKVKPKEA